jgi:hypothetical protein
LFIVNFVFRSLEAREDQQIVGGQNQLLRRERIGSSFAFFDRRYTSRWWLPLAVTDQQIRLIGATCSTKTTPFSFCVFSRFDARLFANMSRSLTESVASSSMHTPCFTLPMTQRTSTEDTHPHTRIRLETGHTDTRSLFKCAIIREYEIESWPAVRHASECLDESYVRRIGRFFDFNRLFHLIVSRNRRMSYSTDDELLKVRADDSVTPSFWIMIQLLSVACFLLPSFYYFVLRLPFRATATHMRTE